MDLIKEPNPAFNKNLFNKSLYEYNKPITVKILKVGNIYKSRANGKPNFYTEMEILTDFPDCEVYQLNLVGDPITDEKGFKSIVKINAKNQIIGYPYQLQPTATPDLYNVSNKTNFFSILNYAFITKGTVPAGNQQGFKNVTFDEVKEALTGLELKVKVVLVEKTTYKPYYKLVPVE